MGAQANVKAQNLQVLSKAQKNKEREKAQLSKLSLPTVNEAEELLCCGTLEYYDKAYDRVNVKNERPLRKIDRIIHTVTTTDDPVIRKLAKSHPDANVFATDTILATLMCCTRSIYSWDIVVQKNWRENLLG